MQSAEKTFDTPNRGPSKHPLGLRRQTKCKERRLAKTGFRIAQNARNKRGRKTRTQEGHRAKLFENVSCNLQPTCTRANSHLVPSKSIAPSRAKTPEMYAQQYNTNPLVRFCRVAASAALQHSPLLRPTGYRRLMASLLDFLYSPM